jgi:hypothetical protein
VSADLVAFMLGCLDEDQQIARAACIRSNGEVAEHWHWVTTETDTPVPDRDIDEALNHQPVSLRSVEEFPTGSVGLLPSFVIHREEEQPEGLPHIARWDPARVLAEVAAKRAVLDECAAAIKAGELQDGTTWNDMAVGAELAIDVVRLLVQPYADRPGFDPIWRTA